ncbi:MAG TPA: TRAFs-binding domain-containing protein [Mycobacterium sp.]|nr:TRAFs-binding domain-containing protein [Mycobacterium sp.]HTX93354.1 TRAFs-binding domain-containing protein [Mycobacterium sp.]
MAENWTDLAPHPDPVQPGKKWHVFVSYRSTNRPWVLALYDILNGLGYKVFLDQYVLTAAAPLALSLGEALDSSESAILVWSGGYEGSEWCMQEAATLETKQNRKDGFRYVIAKIDDSEITGLAQTKLWVDFSQQREGPSGTSLLKLLYGLEGAPLPPGAVKLAAKVDDEMRDGLLDIKACRGIGDAEGLVALANTDNMAWQGSPMLMCAAAEGLIGMRKLTEAIAVLDRAEQAFPKAVRPKQLRGLALARSGATMQAQLVLGRLHAAGEIGPETLGIFARTWMDRYTETGEITFLLKSRDLYRQAFEAFPADYYTGINAASKSLLAGEKETAAQIAERVQKVVGDKPVVDDYWRTATIAEAQLLQGNVEAAAKTYRAAVLAAPLDSGSHDSTRAQAALLLSALGASDEQKALVMAAFPADGKTGHPVHP